MKLYNLLFEQTRNLEKPAKILQKKVADFMGLPENVVDIVPVNGIQYWVGPVNKNSKSYYRFQIGENDVKGFTPTKPGDPSFNRELEEAIFTGRISLENLTHQALNTLVKEMMEQFGKENLMGDGDVDMFGKAMEESLKEFLKIDRIIKRDTHYVDFLYKGEKYDILISGYDETDQKMKLRKDYSALAVIDLEEHVLVPLLQRSFFLSKTPYEKHIEKMIKGFIKPRVAHLVKEAGLA